MKVVQITLTEEEHKLLEDYARRRSKSIKEVVREALRNAVEGKVVSEDRIFSRPPVSGKTRRRDAGSVERDQYLYGATS